MYLSFQLVAIAYTIFFYWAHVVECTIRMVNKKKFFTVQMTICNAYNFTFSYSMHCLYCWCLWVKRKKVCAFFFYFIFLLSIYGWFDAIKTPFLCFIPVFSFSKNVGFSPNNFLNKLYLPMKSWNTLGLAKRFENELNQHFCKMNKYQKYPCVFQKKKSNEIFISRTARE